MNILQLTLILILPHLNFACTDFCEFKTLHSENLIEKNSLTPRIQSTIPAVPNQKLDRIVIRDLIQSEVSQSLRRVNPLLTTWILLAVLVPSASVLSILILFFKVTRNSRRISLHLDAIKDDFMPEFYARIYEAQDIVYDLQDSFQVTEATLQGIQDKLESLSTQDDDLEEYTVEDDKNRLRNRRVNVSKT